MSDCLTVAELENKTLKEVYSYTKEFKTPYYSKMSKRELSLAVIRAQVEKQGLYYMEGILDIVGQDGYGFLQPINYGPSAEDVYIPAPQIKRSSLRSRDKVARKARPPRESERYYGLIHVESVNGKDSEEAEERPHLPALTPPCPQRQLQLKTTPQRLSTRMIGIFSPIGFDQHGLVVTPPKAGKTSVLKKIANGITENYPKVELVVLLIGERSEEVTDLERSVKGNVVSSTFDLQPQNHTRVSELALERATRLVEDKQDVVILMDSATRLARVYNLAVPPSGRTLGGGVDPAALHKPKKFFGAARSIGGDDSLTILATALVDIGSRMDDMIYGEFKGTGDLELQLSRGLSKRRIFPAIDIKRSGTRKEELLMPSEELEKTRKLRKNMTRDSLKHTKQLTRSLRRTESNQ